MDSKIGVSSYITAMGMNNINYTVGFSLETSTIEKYQSSSTEGTTSETTNGTTSGSSSSTSGSTSSSDTTTESTVKKENYIL